MKEIWKDIEGYEGLYQVSSQGKIKSLNYNKTGQERVMKLHLNTKGYLQVALCKGSKIKRYYIHRLVAQAFIPNPSNKPCIDHINAIKTDNRVDNLRWVTYKENNDNPLTKERYRISIIESKTKKVICDGAVFDSITQCAEYYGIIRTTMSRWLTGYRTMPTDFKAKGLRYFIEE